MPTPFFADLVRELCHEGGTGPLTPTGAVPGHRRFAGAVPADTEFHYAIAGIAQPGEWEVGTGRLDAAGRLVREAVAASSDDGGRVDFAPGLKTLALTVGAGWFTAHDAAVAALDAADDDLAVAIAAKQPLSTAHPAATTGADDDLMTVRRGAGWVNIPLAALVRRGADGHVGIGTANPAQLLELAGGSPRMRIVPAASEQTGGIEIVTDGAHEASFTARGSTGELNIAAGRAPGWGGNIRFFTDTTEKMRLTAAGRLLLGGAADNYMLNIASGAASRGIVADFNTNGHVGALISFTQAGITNNCFGTIPGTGDFGWYVNRNGVADGVLLMRLTAAGSLGIGTDTAAVRLHVKSSGEIMRLETTAARGSGNGFLSFYDPSGRKGYFGYGGTSETIFLMNEENGNIEFGTNAVSRWYVESAGHFTPVADNAYDVGWSAGRVRNLHLASNPIVTSDMREKAWRGAASAAELAAAKRIASELGFYQWNDAVAEKGAEGARLHFGVRAQAVWAIMAGEGLVDPIDAGADPTSRHAFLCWDRWAEERDAEGRIVRAAGERFGIRPDQLALFLIAAQEARLAALEAAA
ncbi:tail fiber domain-containing protein [Sphingopyxis granuli]|uniref:Peptidase S74 n=1 Tax=Sphingopyxis granuli TaxID=267128 RepID=A0AA86GJ90_9SPHN|nr:tail fiber domain-containing protein [Sphingopyxis granuli]AMG73261.1 Peptidase S74 [Sphingopyxis granuli]